MRKITYLLSLISYHLFLIICFCIGNANAMDLSFDMAVEKIVSESHDIKRSDANIARARAGLDAANANRWFNLTADATYMNTVNVENPGAPADLPPELGGIIMAATGGQFDVAGFEMPDNIFMAGLTLTQPIYTFGKIGNAVDSVRSAIKISESGRDIAMREVKYAAANLYWTAKMTDGLVDIYQSSLNDAISARKKLTAAGRANRANLVKIKSDIAAKEVSLSDAKFNRDIAYRMLKILSGIDADETILLTTEIPKNFGELTASPELNSNPQWDLIDQQIRMYEKSASSKRAGNYPTLAATASYSYMDVQTSADKLFSESGSQSAYWGVSLQVPIFDGGLNRANATMDAMNAAAAQSDLDKSKQMLGEEYNTALQKYDHLRGNLKSLENAKDLARRAYNLSRDRFASGQTSAIELSDMSAALSGLDVALLSARYNILMSSESVKKLGN